MNSSVYRRTLAAFAAAIGLGLAALAATAQSQADPILEARDAWQRKDAQRLAAAKANAMARKHPLAMWADYWELNLRLPTATQEELDAFYARWPDTYVEDRLRNDWLLELGRRQDWSNFAAEFPRFRMQDDREVACYAQVVRHLRGNDVSEAARQAWLAQTSATDQGCGFMAALLYRAGRLAEADLWYKARLMADVNRRAQARQAVAIVGPEWAQRFDEMYDNPARFLARKAGTGSRAEAELATLALMRLAASDPLVAAAQLESWSSRLPADLASWAWASAGRQAALRLLPQAPDYFQRASLGADETRWSADMLAWRARAALRAGRWQQVVQAIDAMGPAEQADPAWVYWKARALQAIAGDAQDGEPLRAEARRMLESIAGQHHYYGLLAAEDLGQPLVLPTPPVPLTGEEKRAVRRIPGLVRALQLIEMGLRSEGVREWNWTLSFTSRGRLGERELLAAADLACEHEVWDRCINTSERTRSVFHLEQRYPMPFRREVVARAREIGLDPAYVYGLIRQESRFVMDARSHVGASGLMQLMPATARWTARKIGLQYTPARLTDRDTNIMLGTSYLKLVLDDQGGSQALGAAAYNAGPARPRRWREGPELDAAIWVENIPFSETREYVKRVLANATYYAARLNGGEMPSLRGRLGHTIGPRPAEEAPMVADLP
ncbi:soluble lytic murein transglycosylase [Caldimonas thermodepolymerans]|nr:lytic transglycosylase domain-containing protein [Caldimonas thermodepolymerans]RDI01459.1 soluble lytic murein transglycosylase [Caldimonas thermodepolymerans]